MRKRVAYNEELDDLANSIRKNQWDYLALSVNQEFNFYSEREVPCCKSLKTVCFHTENSLGCCKRTQCSSCLYAESRTVGMTVRMNVCDLMLKLQKYGPGTLVWTQSCLRLLKSVFHSRVPVSKLLTGNTSCSMLFPCIVCWHCLGDAG